MNEYWGARRGEVELSQGKDVFFNKVCEKE